MTTPIFSLLFTSARPDLIYNMFDLWKSMAKDWSQCECVLSTCGLDPFLYQTDLAARLGLMYFPQDEPPYTSIQGWNNAARHAKGHVLVQIADDLWPCQHWDKALLEAIDEHFHHTFYIRKTEVVLWCSDGYKPDLMTHVVMSRAFYERQGYFLCPEYHSVYADNELMEVVQRDGRLIDARHIVFEHRHHENGKRARDAVDVTQEIYERDREIYERRKKAGFPPVNLKS